MEDNLSYYNGSIWIRPIKAGDNKAVEWFIEAINQLEFDDFGLDICQYRQDGESYRLEFSGFGSDFLCNYLGRFKEMFLVPNADLKTNLHKLILRQVAKRIKRLQFSYYDYNLVERYLDDDTYIVEFQEGMVAYVEEEDSDPHECDALNLKYYDIFDEVYDCQIYTLRTIVETGKVPLEEACILKMLNSDHDFEQLGDLSDYLCQNHEDKFYFSFEDFWNANGKLIHDWIARNCVIDTTLGEIVSKINNTILLLDGKEQLYEWKRKYTARCIQDFFFIAERSMTGPSMEDVVDLLESMENKPLCVEMFLEVIGPSF